MPEPVVLVTGASSGIGAAIARAAGVTGNRVVLAARDTAALERVAGDIGADRALTVRCDVTEWEDQQRMVAAALDRFGRIDAVVANAGFGAKRGFLNESPEHWRDMVLTNVLGAALTVRATVEELRRTTGHLVLMGSAAGRKVVPGSIYSCTKHAVHAMGEAARQELHGSGVRVTVVAPGTVRTPFYEDPPTGVLEPEDVARSVLWVLGQPPHMDVNEVLVRPVSQEF